MHDSQHTPRFAVTFALACAALTGACSGSSPVGGIGADAARVSDAANSDAKGLGTVGEGSALKPPDGSMDGDLLDVMETGSTADEGPPDEGIADAGMPETFDGDGGLEVTWTEGCWYETGGMKYQAMSFTVVSKTALPLEATLYYNATCDPSGGTDNLNDTGGTTPAGSWLFWFIHHPDEKNTSAIWSYGGIQSACINYNVAPDCS
jgi:hypothetical protein